MDTWKKILLFASPAVIASVAGLYFYYSYSRVPKKTSGASELATREQTPLETAIALKDRGNRNFKVGRYAKAVECYTEALEQCPSYAVDERATFYQNRAAARENLHELDAALADCNAALELVPAYLKALNRRARLYERLDDLPHCLLDVTACCLLERFRNSDNVVCMDRVLKQLGQNLAEKEPPRLPRTLPSSDFIKFYFSSWSSDPFTIDAMKASTKRQNSETGKTELVEAAAVVEKEEETNGFDKEAELPQTLVSAYETLLESFAKLQTCDYEASWKLVANAVNNFDSAIEVDQSTFEKSRFGDLEKPDLARTRALLLEATYKALSGDTEEAKKQFVAVGKTLSADPLVRANALIKAAALYMTVEKDMSGCMNCFQEAESLDAKCADVYLHRGQINLLAENLEAAAKDLDEAVRLKPDFSVAQAQKTYLQYRKSENEDNRHLADACLKKFEKLLEKYPTCVETHSLYAQILMEKGDFDKSDQEFARVIELSPKSGLAYSHRGLLRLRHNQDQEAANEWFTRAIEVDPRCELALELRGQLAMEGGDLEKAEESFQSALDEARTLQDRSHLIALREGVRAQKHAAKIYGISIANLFAELKSDLQQKLAAVGEMATPM